MMHILVILLKYLRVDLKLITHHTVDTAGRTTDPVEVGLN